MDSPVIQAGQLISQTHRLSLSSPVHVPVTDDTTQAMGTRHLSPAVYAVADAQPAEISHYAGFTHASPTSPDACLQEQTLTRLSHLEQLPNEVLFHILGFLDVNDLLSTSRVGV